MTGRRLKTGPISVSFGPIFGPILDWFSCVPRSDRSDFGLEIRARTRKCGQNWPKPAKTGQNGPSLAHFAPLSFHWSLSPHVGLDARFGQA
jgi:hypothetical protein